jgi:hypothetical protein
MVLSKEPFLFKKAHLREFWNTSETPRSQLTDKGSFLRSRDESRSRSTIRFSILVVHEHFEGLNLTSSRSFIHFKQIWS